MPLRDNDFHSGEAQEIMGRAPSWVVRWGITVIFLLLALIVLGCCIIKYPQVVTAPITLTTVNPPADLTARYDGLLDSVCVANGDSVRKGQLLALLATPADYDDISAVEEHLRTSFGQPFGECVGQAWLTDAYTLGDLQPAWADFLRQSLDYHHYLTVDYIGTKKRLLRMQIEKNNAYYTKLKRQHRLVAADLAVGGKALKRDSVLLAETVISDADYEATLQNYLSKQNSEAGFDAALSTTELTILQNRQQLVELSMQEENERAQYERTLGQLRQQLLAQIAQWKEQYAFIAPSDGQVSLHGYWSEGQHVSVGDVLVSVVPAGKTEVVGRMEVPSAGFGKVAAGQTVNVKLHGFPYMEYGILRGAIRSVSSVPTQTQSLGGRTVAYTVEVAFPEGLRTTYKRELPMIQRMDGTGEIVTEDMRLIEQFIRPIVSLLKNN